MENDLTSLDWLSQAIRKATRAAKFCVAGSLPAVDPGLEVHGVGRIPLPLKPRVAKQLIAACASAPYGQGTQTLVDKKVRNTFELDPQEFRLSDEWNAAVADTTRVVAQELGLPVEQLEARLYKLLVYEKGGFFLPHRDSEKHDRMVASLIIVLPQPFGGGTLVVRHGEGEQKLTFNEAAVGRVPDYAAFYADCEHEVLKVSRGVRICLAYNLVLKARPVKPAAAANPALEGVAESIGAWTAKQPGKPLVFALEHRYTERGLSLELLKGADRALADLIVSAARQSDCMIHLAQVSRHLLQWADDGSFGRGYSYRSSPSRRSLSLGETYEDDLMGTEWTNVDGRKQPWGDIDFDLTSIISATPIDKWTPTSEEFEGYTGNAGNTLDRWYHRSAIVVWHRDHHFDVIASSGAHDSIPLLLSMAAKLSTTPKKRLAESRADCIRFARAIIAKWPSRAVGCHTSEKSVLQEFPDLLLTLGDRDSIAMFLSMLAQQDSTLPLRSFVVSACRQFGWDAFAEELKGLLAVHSHRGGREAFSLRDIEWLAAYCGDKTVDPHKSALARTLCAMAARRFSEPLPQQTAYSSRYRRQEPSDEESALPGLLKALMAGGCDEGLAQVICFVQDAPDEFRMDQCQVPCLNLLIPWSRKQFGQIPAPLASWLASVRRQLEAATARAPTPPADWARPAEVDCRCQSCARFNAFLADPAREVEQVPAPENLRGHLTDKIRHHQCDVKEALLRTGRPYSLVLTKTTGSHERAVARFGKNRKLLESLPSEG